MYLAVDVEGVGRVEYLVKFVFIINGSYVLGGLTQCLMKYIQDKCLKGKFLCAAIINPVASRQGMTGIRGQKSLSPS